MNKIFFLINEFDEFNFHELIEKHLDDVNVTIGNTLPVHTDEYDLVVLWNYRKIIKNIEGRKNIMLFHSSNLPYGKGWAPIYHAIASGQKYYTITGLFAAEDVDSGNIIVKARFRIKDNYIAEYIRAWDNEISIILIKKILQRFGKNKIIGKKQIERGNFNTRRYPEQSEISIDSKFKKIISHLRACEKNHPAFFFYKKTKYIVNIQPIDRPKFPSDLKIKFYGRG